MDLCHHCKRNKANRPRGLCSPCYFNVAVRRLYPSVSKYASRGHGIEGQDGNPTASLEGLLGEPTDEEPGAEGKIGEMERRARECRPIFHPGDRAADLS